MINQFLKRNDVKFEICRNNMKNSLKWMKKDTLTMVCRRVKREGGTIIID